MNVQFSDCFCQTDTSSLSATRSLHLGSLILWTSEAVGLIMHPSLAGGNIEVNWENLDMAVRRT